MNLLKTIFVLVVFLSTTAVCSAQSPEKKAQKLADEVGEVLSLSKKETKGVYEIQLVRFQTLKDINQNHQGDDSEKQEMRKELANKTYREMKTFLGPERIKQWDDYKKSKN